MNWIPFICIMIFMGLLLLINRKNFGVKSFNDYATASNSFGFLSITFAVLSTWYVGSCYTAWAGMAVSLGQQAMYATGQAMAVTIVMFMFSERTWIWGKKWNVTTQGDLIGRRYQSKILQLLTSIWGIVFTVPWLLLEWITQGYVFHYASGGRLPTWVGMLIGILVVLIYVTAGGMRSVITANFLQGCIMVVGATFLFTYLITKYFGGIGEGYQMMIRDFKDMLTFPGPGGAGTSMAVYTSMVVCSGLGGFMWPWCYNKMFASSSVREIKKSALLTPVLGALYYLLFVILSNFMHSMPEALANPEQAWFYLFEKAGVWPLAFLGVLIMAVSVGTVSGIVQSISSGVAGDILPFLKKNIADKDAVRVARITVIVLCAGSFLYAILFKTGALMNIVLLVYQGIIMLFPVIALGLFWRRANKEGAIIGLVGGTILSFSLYIGVPGTVGGWGWSPGVYGLIFCFAAMIICGFLKPPTEETHRIFTELAIIKAKAKLKKSNPA